jgi:acyl-ACP thioesterase
MPKVFRKKLTVSNDAIDMFNHVNNIVYLNWMQEIAILSLSFSFAARAAIRSDFVMMMVSV